MFDISQWTELHAPSIKKLSSPVFGVLISPGTIDLKMTKYTNEKKEHALSQMSTLHNTLVAEVAQLTCVPEATLYL